MKNFIEFVISILIVFVGVLGALIAYDRFEVEECNRWQHHAETAPNFYLVSWQAAQCDAHDIEIDAPVK